MKIKISELEDRTIILEIQGSRQSKSGDLLLAKIDNRIKKQERLVGKIDSDIDYLNLVLTIRIPPRNSGAVLFKSIFRPKSRFQKDDCFYPICQNNRSTLEAVFGAAEIRCCENENCKNYAANIAESIGNLKETLSKR